ncbi:MAG: hypothetical protein PHQ74_06845 [Crocinitomicaceae bacterium]|nr:hypothetical protein [Crocinitomicaceae bacterium]
MSKRIQLVILLFALLQTACKREIIPTPPSNLPVFGIEGIFFADTFKLIAGENQVVMTPSLIEMDGIQIYSGKIGNENSYFQMEIYNGNIDFQKQPKFDINELNTVTFAPYNQGALWSISKSDFPNASSISQIMWYVDGIEQQMLDKLVIYKPGKFEICAKVRFEDQSESTLCRTIVVGFKKNANFEINYEIPASSRLLASVSTTDAISNIKWYLNEVLISKNPSIDTVLSIGKYELRSEVLFENGVIQNRAALVDVSVNRNDVPDFSALAFENQVFWDNKAVITYFRNGALYSSINEYNEEKTISIEDLVFYSLDSSGIPIFFMKGNLDLNLTNMNGQQYPFKGKMSIGFSVK